MCKNKTNLFLHKSTFKLSKIQITLFSDMAKKELRQVLARTRILYQEMVIEFKTKQRLIKELNQVQKSISKLDIKLIAILLPRHVL